LVAASAPDSGTWPVSCAAMVPTSGAAMHGQDTRLLHVEDGGETAGEVLNVEGVGRPFRLRATWVGAASVLLLCTGAALSLGAPHLLSTGSLKRTDGKFEVVMAAAGGPSEQKEAPTITFYMYRAAAEGALEKYEFGDINTGNMDGVVWYLMNEVVTMYTAGVRCPRKFNISMIHRFKITMKSTPELFATGMNFGARFAYDTGKCMGRCFPKNMCTGTDDCDYHYKKYGYNPGCNNFYDHYPFPDYNTPAERGIWYTLPLAGRCDNPTGAHDCTWAYEYAGNISLWDMEKAAKAEANWGDVNCCDGHCSQFWNDQFSTWRTSWRVQQALQTFADKYPDISADIGSGTCDFQWPKWYEVDRWDRRDPWAAFHTHDEDKK